MYGIILLIFFGSALAGSTERENGLRKNENSGVVFIEPETGEVRLTNRFVPEMIADDHEQLKKAKYCHEAPDGGHGKRSMDLFYYDVGESKCKTFKYKGQGGNFNKFFTMENCETTCGVLAKLTDMTFDTESEVGPGSH